MSTSLSARAGLIGIATGLLGAASALLMLAWPPQVDEQLVSYPFTTEGFRAIQAWYFVHHLGLVLLLVALADSGAIGRRRLARGGAWAAVAGMVLLTVAELLSMRYATWDVDLANAGLMGSTYGVAVSVVGAGLILAGLGVLRARLWSGGRQWIPLAVGLAAFVVVTPGMFSGYVVARLAIGTWMLLFAALGWALHVEGRRFDGPGSALASRGAWPADRGANLSSNAVG